MHSCWINTSEVDKWKFMWIEKVWINKFSQVICTLTEILCWVCEHYVGTLSVWMQLHCQHTIKRRYSQERTDNLRSHSVEIQKQFLSLSFSPLFAMWVWGIYLGTSISLFVSDSAVLTEPGDEFKLRTHHIFSTSFLITVVLLWQCVVLLFSANCRAASVLLCLVSGKASDNKPLTLSIKLHILHTIHLSSRIWMILQTIS